MGLEALLPTLLPVASRVLGNLGMNQAAGYTQQAQQLYSAYQQARPQQIAAPRPPVIIRLPAQPLGQTAQQSDNTVLYIAGGAAALAAVYFLMMRK